MAKNNEQISSIKQKNKNKKKPKNIKFLGNSLLLKQTLISAWKSKLQLVILLLLTTFATSLITGSWISYQRVIEAENYLELDKANFDAVLPYSNENGITQITNQAFSLKLGRLYYQANQESPVVGLYYDNTIIGQEIMPLDVNDLQIAYTRNETTNAIEGITNFQWSNPNKPLTFNIENDNVKASIYGQLLLKAKSTNNNLLKNHYLNAANELYNRLFVNFSANQILNSLNTYFTGWIQVNNTAKELTLADKDFTDFLITNKINYRGTGAGDLSIPDGFNLFDDINDVNGVLAKRLVKNTDENPRLTSEYGMNGQWMIIYRNFDLNPTPSEDVIKDFSHQYSSPSNYNIASDGYEPNIYSYALTEAAAALQNRDVTMVNQFVGTSGVDTTGKSISVKVVNLGLKSLNNNVNLKIFEGLFPSSRNEVAISPQYARGNNIKPGQTISINNKPFIVSGIGGDAYNIYPTINSLDPVPNTRSEFIAYVLPDAFHDSSWFGPNDKTDISLMYFNRWNDVSVPDFNTSYFNDYFQKSIFNDNKFNDRNQYDYNNYLIEKYLKDNPDYQSSYQLEQNLVVTKDDAQFSAYAKGRSILDSTLYGFKYAAFAGVIFLVLIVIFITYLIVKKAIIKTQVSMGILKSSGYSTLRIIVSYLAYPLLVLVIAIPIGWFIGLSIQVYFTELFNSLFILPYNVLDFSIVPLFISIVAIAGFVLIATLLTGYKILQKEPLMLIKKDSDIAVGFIHKVGWLQRRMSNNFKSRFILSLSKTNWKKITVTAVVIAVAALAITTTVSVPATITSMKDNYFKTQKYKNYYQYQTPIANMPLSKYGLYAWNNLDNARDEPFYPVSGVMPWPESIIINDQNTGEKLAWYNPLEYEKTGDNSNNFSSIIHFQDGVPETVRDQITTQVGDALLNLANGPLDINFLTWSYSWLGARGFSNALLKDLADRDKSNNQIFSSSLINFASTLLPGILQVTNPGVQPGKDAITEILKQTLPGFIRQVLDSKGQDAYDYFSIGHNTVAYNPNYILEINGAQEELTTHLQLGSVDNNLYGNGFLDVAGINPDTKMLVMKSNLIDRLKYNSDDKVIPMVINQSFAARYNLKVNREFNAAPNVRTLYYVDKQNKFKPLPKNSWYYGEDPANISPTDEGQKTIWSNSANKWNYRGQKPIDNTNYNDSYGYEYNGVYDKEGKRILSKSPEPWNNVNNIWLKLPEDINEAARSGTLRSANANGSLAFDVKNIAYDGNSPVDNYWIKPLSYEVTNDHHNKPLNPTTLLTTRIPEWYGAMLDKNILKVDNTLHLDSLKSDIENNIPSWWENIVSDNSGPITRYRVIGIQDSYDTPRAYIDQKWANLIAGYSYYNDRSINKDPTYGEGIYQWFSAKLSAADDIYDIIGRMSFKRNADDYTMYAMNQLNGNQQEMLIANSDLLSRKKEMLDKMADIAFSASVLFIVTTIVCSILIVIMITDSFTEQFRSFMSHMKAEGYTNREINSFTLGIFTPWVLFGYVAGYALGYLVVFGFIKAVTLITGLALPFSFIWWVIPFSFVIIAVIYISTFIINTYQLNRMDLIALLKSDE